MNSLLHLWPCFITPCIMDPQWSQKVGVVYVASSHWWLRWSACCFRPITAAVVSKLPTIAISDFIRLCIYLFNHTHMHTHKKRENRCHILLFKYASVMNFSNKYDLIFKVTRRPSTPSIWTQFITRPNPYVHQKQMTLKQIEKKEREKKWKDKRIQATFYVMIFQIIITTITNTIWRRNTF